MLPCVWLMPLALGTGHRIPHWLLCLCWSKNSSNLLQSQPLERVPQDSCYLPITCSGIQGNMMGQAWVMCLSPSCTGGWKGKHMVCSALNYKAVRTFLKHKKVLQMLSLQQSDRCVLKKVTRKEPDHKALITVKKCRLESWRPWEPLKVVSRSNLIGFAFLEDHSESWRRILGQERLEDDQ